MKTVIFTALLLLAGRVVQAQCNAHLMVSGASEVPQGELIVFSAGVSDVPANSPVTFRWSVSNGEIADGQGTAAIQMKSTGIKVGETVTATVEIGGLPQECGSLIDSSTTGITEPEKKASVKQGRK